MKRILYIFLTLIIITQISFSVYAEEAILPQYDNAESADIRFSISSTGVANIAVSATGNSNTKEMKSVTYIEKKINGSWYRVDITPINDEWVYSTTNNLIKQYYSTQLRSNGEYRAVTKFTFKTTTIEIVTKMKNATY